MSNEEFQRRMDFIVDQQAQFSADMVQLRAAQAETEQIVTRAGQVLVHTGEVVTRLAKATLEGFKDVNAKIDALVDAQIRTDEQQRRTEERQQSTDEQVRRTNESVRNLRAAVDRHFRKGRNGG